MTAQEWGLVLTGLAAADRESNAGAAAILQEHMGMRMRMMFFVVV